MSAAFSLDFTGPEVKCDFRGCILDAWHDGDHQFAPPKPQFAPERIHKCAVCGNRFVIYGEHQQPSHLSERMTCGDPVCILALAKRGSTDAPLLCSCPQRPYPHELSIHARIRSEKPGRYTVWSGLRGDPFAEEVVQFASDGFRWPWSLMLSKREEPSTERKVAA